MFGTDDLNRRKSHFEERGCPTQARFGFRRTFAMACLGWSALAFFGSGCQKSAQPAKSWQKAFEATQVSRNVILRLHGSNTIGAKLAPSLVRTWFMQQGADTVMDLEGTNPEEVSVQARFGSQVRTVEIWSHGSNTGFDDLAWGRCDIGMSSKPIDQEAVQRLAGLGNMHAATNEHVLGLDGIAIIVNPENPLVKLDAKQVADLFTGRINNWRTLKHGRSGQVVRYTRDHNSGTFDVFKHAVLAGRPLADSAIVCESNEKLAEAVAADPHGIGFTPLGTIGATKALLITSGTETALAPDKDNIATEDYPLSRRLFLYTPTESANPEVKSFIEFCQSEPGQLVVENTGFVAQILRLSKPQIPEGAPIRYRAEARNALRMAIDFRFRPGSYELDNKARRDLGRLAKFVDKEHLRPCHLKLFGFCDNVGGTQRNLFLSEERAKVVADSLRHGYGIEAAIVMGFGSALPIASNENDMGKERNRRIEVWMECTADLASAVESE